MSEFAEGYAVGQNNNQNNGYGCGFGGDWAWIIIFALIFGWGGNGAWGNNGGGNGQMMYDLGKVATTNDVASGFNNSAVLNNLNDLRLGQADLQQTLCQGFNATQREISDCCCQTQRAIDNVNFNMERNTCSINQNMNAGFQRMLGYWCQRDMQQLRDERDGYRNQLQLNNQAANITNAIINRLDPPAVPSYTVPNPYTGQYGYGNCGTQRSCFSNSNCNCGC